MRWLQGSIRLLKTKARWREMTYGLHFKLALVHAERDKASLERRVAERRMHAFLPRNFRFGTPEGLSRIGMSCPAL
jgi:hypothetical protein